MTTVCEGRSDEAQQVVRQALACARQAHLAQTRASGEPYLIHCLAVAEIVHHLHLDHEAVSAALLHDVVEDTDVSLDKLRDEFGDSVASLVDGVTKMGHIDEIREPTVKAPVSHHAESMRKLLLAMAEDVRVVLIKLADRLHNMRTLRHLSEQRQRRIARGSRSTDRSTERCCPRGRPS